MGPFAGPLKDPQRMVDTTAMSRLAALTLLALLAVPAILATPVADARPSKPVRVLCARMSDGAGFAMKAPRRCIVLPPHEPLAGAVYLAGLRWDGDWGAPVVEGTGVSIGFHLPRVHVPVAVALSDPRPDNCGYGLVLYTRMLVTYADGSRVYKTQSCDGAW